MALNDEILKVYRAGEKAGNKTAAEVLKQYRIVLEDLNTEIAKISLKYAVDGELRIGQRQRLALSQAIAKQIKQECRELANMQDGLLNDSLADIINDTYLSTAYALDKGVEIEKSFGLLTKEFIHAAINREIDGKTFSNRIWDNCTALAGRVKRDIQQAMIEGRSVEKLARQIKYDFGVGAYQAKRLINTEVARAMTEAQDEAYKNSGVVDACMWVATLEENTCDVCAEHDGRYYPVGAHPDLPAHPDCRCTIVPVVREWEPKQRRNAEDGSVIDYTSVAAWRESKGL